MVTRQEQFEQDRQAMLRSIGAEPDEVQIETNEPEIIEDQPDEEIIDRDADLDFQEKLEDLKADNPSADEYERRALQAFNEKCDFENSLSKMNREDAKTARKMKHNQRKRVQQRLEQHGEVNALGMIPELLDNFQATCGGGVLYMFYILLVVLPIGVHWYAKENWLCGFIAFGVVAFASRVLSMWLSFIARGIVAIAMKIGPQFVCEVKEGTPALKLTVSFLNFILWLATNAHILTFVTMFSLIAYTMEWTKYQWINTYLTALGVSTVAAFIAWFFWSLIGYSIYSGIIGSLMSGSHPTKYRLRYLHDSNRIMIPTRKCTGKFVSETERLQAFQRDYAGVA